MNWNLKKINNPNKNPQRIQISQLVLNLDKDITYANRITINDVRTSSIRSWANEVINGFDRYKMKEKNAVFLPKIFFAVKYTKTDVAKSRKIWTILTVCKSSGLVKL